MTGDRAEDAHEDRVREDEPFAAQGAPGAAPEREATELARWIGLLAAAVGPRPPTSDGERRAAELLASTLRERGVDATLEPFDGYPSFALPFGLTLGAAIAPALLPRSRRRARSALAALAAGMLLTEGSLVRAPLSELISRWPSQNVVAVIEPRAGTERTLCLMAHYDSSRSGLMFHPRLVGWMGRWIGLASLLVLAGSAEPLAPRSRRLRGALMGGRAALAGALALLFERELRGVDVAGANDNASGAAVVATLACELAANPATTTRIVVCLTGCEEAGTLGARALLDSRDTSDWLFLNFDNVAGGGTVRYLRREGVIARWDADPGLIAAAETVARENPDLRVAAEDAPAGLTYDSSPVHARGGRALTFSVQDGFIPNLHLPSDTVANADIGSVVRTLETARRMVVAVDARAADGGAR